MNNESRTNYQLVKDWMEQAGQDVPDQITKLENGVLSLRRTLIEEEARECLAAFAMYNRCRGSDAAVAGLLKELSDVLVVVYGAFVALGVDGDEAFRLVMVNNFEKLTAHTFRGDGKVVVPPEKKQELKTRVMSNLLDLIT